MQKKKTTAELVAEKPPLDEFRNKKRHPIYIVLHNVRSLQNVGIVFRLSDALLVQKLYLTGYTGYPMVDGDVPGLGRHDNRENRVKYHAQQEIEKTAIQTVPLVPWEYHSDGKSVIKELSNKGVQIIAVEQTHNAIDYSHISYKFPICLVFGHERHGIDDEILELADQTAEIPMYGIGNSLNVATSVAVIGYHLANLLANLR